MTDYKPISAKYTRCFDKKPFDNKTFAIILFFIKYLKACLVRILKIFININPLIDACRLIVFVSFYNNYSAIWHTMGKVTVIAKRELLYAGPFGLAAWLCGLVFINKRDVTESRELMRVAMEKLKRENIKLWVFPEGECCIFVV
jgi:hypothetical protein